MFSRDVPGVQPVQVSDTVLPSRGSRHAAFVEMLFLWGSPHEHNPAFRFVVLPSGFSLHSTAPGEWTTRDRDGYSRASVIVPGVRGGVPSISPMKRFSYGSDPSGGGFRGIVSDWDSIVYRTAVRKTQPDALFMAKKWLDDNKPRWDSYISAVNFERRSTG